MFLMRFRLLRILVFRSSRGLVWLVCLNWRRWAMEWVVIAGRRSYRRSICWFHDWTRNRVTVINLGSVIQRLVFNWIVLEVPLTTARPIVFSTKAKSAIPREDCSDDDGCNETFDDEDKTCSTISSLFKIRPSVVCSIGRLTKWKVYIY